MHINKYIKQQIQKVYYDTKLFPSTQSGVHYLTLHSLTWDQKQTGLVVIMDAYNFLKDTVTWCSDYNMVYSEKF